MNEDKASRYQRLRRRTTVIAAAWSVVLLVALLCTGGAHSLRIVSESATAGLPGPAALRQAAASACLAFALLVMHEAGALPLAYYSGFTLERRYGLSRQPASAWFLDHLKAASLGAATVLLAAIWMSACLRAVPSWWWLAVWLPAVAGGVLLAWVAPVWLFPLFHRLSALRHDGLRDRLASLAARAGVPVFSVFEWAIGHRTSLANAALVGIGRTRRILVSDTLVAGYTADEVEVVLAHELAHHVHRDLWKTLAFQSLMLAAGLWAAHLALGWFAVPLGLHDQAGLEALPLVALCLVAVSGLGGPAGHLLSRAQERRADRFALDLTEKPDAFASAIRRLSAHHLTEEDPRMWVTILFCAHPPVPERLACARNWRLEHERARAKRH